MLAVAAASHLSIGRQHASVTRMKRHDPIDVPGIQCRFLSKIKLDLNIIINIIEVSFNIT